jgi:hypothetical protein
MAKMNASRLLILKILLLYIVVVTLEVLARWSLVASCVPCILLCPLTTSVYGSLHDHFHVGRKRVGAILYESLGVFAAANFGFNWVYYKRHHANHHKFNNGPGDYSTTLTTDGRFYAGSTYLFRNTVWPFLFQLVPFSSVLAKKRKNRTLLAWMDEAARVGLRVLSFILGGWSGLIVILIWQFVFMNQLLYLNYLQHFDCELGQAIIWKNRYAGGLGLHDQHHSKPFLSATELESVPVDESLVRRSVLFNPIGFVLFLCSPERLRSYLGS